MPPGLMIVFVSVVALAGLAFFVGSLLRTQSEQLGFPLDDLALRRRQHAARETPLGARIQHEAKSLSMTERAAG